MTISVGDKLPAASFGRLGADGPEQVDLITLITGKKVVIFAVPGAYTPTCSSAHMPSFVRNADKLRAKGVDEIICISVNDVFVMKSWGDAMGANDVGIHCLADGDSGFTVMIGMDYSAPETGMMARSLRYAMIVEDGIITTLNIENARGVCDISGGENILELL
ncbi:MAG: peroxiredoxin [Amylibacter sp.]|nr:peroxiredoxin [Amylibacter sp.]